MKITIQTAVKNGRRAEEGRTTRIETFRIGRIPAVLYGAASDRVFLFLHGRRGRKEEAAAFAEIAVPSGFQVLGIDLPESGERAGTDDASELTPWAVVPELLTVRRELEARRRRVSIWANSIGAYFAALAFADAPLDRALFVSPIVDMERLILDLLNWAGATEEELRARGEIPTRFGQTLSIRYLDWARRNPIPAGPDWKPPLSILFAARDNLTSRETVAKFAAARAAKLTVDESEDAEHWFHTPSQLERLRAWERQNLR